MKFLQPRTIYLLQLFGCSFTASAIADLTTEYVKGIGIGLIVCLMGMSGINYGWKWREECLKKELYHRVYGRPKS